ncbi:DUF6965 family protein [uncultured Bacteroides sp.]|uniref:DUF6965 family protein n=1 Tax=uncultured Bacteroides sp. TaxID=162156 RepID=UPI002AAAFD84|nr:hypothetical protein [uncultured Bacteroides sp.]
MDYKFDEESIQSILEWAKNIQAPQTIQLSEYENIENLPQYIITNIYDIKQHYPDPLYNSAIIRLYRLKEFMEK